MADPLSASSAIIGLVPVAFVAAKALRDTIRDIKNHPKQIRGLLSELEDLVNVLAELESILHSPGQVTLNLLEAPLRRCNSACKEFLKALQDCRGRSSGGTTSDFTGWLKIRWRGSDINEFKDTLAGYKSTMAIAVSGANLRTTRVSLDVIKEYQKMIEDTKADLNEHISNINDKLSKTFETQFDPEDPVSELDMEAERDCTLQCLEVCAQMTTFIEERQNVLLTHSRDSEEDSTLGAARSSSSSSSQRATGETLRNCNFNVKAQHAQLSNRLQYLNTRLNNSPEGQRKSAERATMIEEVTTIQQCLDILEQNAKSADKARVNLVEDVASADDSNQVIVSTFGELISAHRVTSGIRSNMTIGQLSDETVQHIHSVHAARLVDMAKLQLEQRAGRESVNSTGRVLGQSNIRTL